MRKTVATHLVADRPLTEEQVRVAVEGAGYSLAL